MPQPTTTSPFISAPLHTATYPTTLVLREDHKMSKPDMTPLRRFRSGHHPALRRWQHLINRSEEATCRICNDEDETYDHLWLRCPAFDAERLRLDLGESIENLHLSPRVCGDSTTTITQDHMTGIVTRVCCRLSKHCPTYHCEPPRLTLIYRWCTHETVSP